MLESEVLIIGGGPAGATVAKELSNAGVSNILIQRNMSFKKPCGGGIRMDAFSDFNITKELIKYEISTISLVHKNKKIDVDIQQSPLAIVDRVAFDSALREAAKQSGTELIEAAFVDVEVYDDYIVAEIKVDERVQKIKAKHLVAADGVNSKVRKIINADSVCSLMTKYADLVEYAAPESCEFHFSKSISKNYYAWVFPQSNGANIGTLAGEDEHPMQAFVKDLCVEESFKTLGYKIPEFQNRIFYKNRVFFVGDSASQVLPFTYEGIYYAMHSAKILATVLAQKCDPQEYEKRWNRAYLKKFQTLQKLQKIFLYNDFTIGVMLKLYRSEKLQKRIINLWLKDEELEINLRFFLKLIKRVFTPRLST